MHAHHCRSIEISRLRARAHVEDGSKGMLTSVPVMEGNYILLYVVPWLAEGSRPREAPLSNAIGLPDTLIKVTRICFVERICKDHSENVAPTFNIRKSQEELRKRLDERTEQDLARPLRD